MDVDAFRSFFDNRLGLGFRILSSSRNCPCIFCCTDICISFADRTNSSGCRAIFFEEPRLFRDQDRLADVDLERDEPDGGHDRLVDTSFGLVLDFELDFECERLRDLVRVLERFRDLVRDLERRLLDRDLEREREREWLRDLRDLDRRNLDLRRECERECDRLFDLEYDLDRLRSCSSS